MLESFPVSILAGALLGFLSGLGVGGGSLLILWLNLVLNMDLQTARGINLLFFLPAAAISLFFRRKQGAVDFSRLLPALIAGPAAAAALSLLNLDSPGLKKSFGLLLLFTGLRELFYKPKTA